MRGNDTPCEEGVKRMREVTSVGKRRKMTEGREETSNPGEKPFFVELSHMKRFQVKCQKLAWKAMCKAFKLNISETT